MEITRLSDVQILNKTDKDKVKYLNYQKYDVTCIRNRSRNTRGVNNSPSVALLDVNSILNSLSIEKFLKVSHVRPKLFSLDNIFTRLMTSFIKIKLNHLTRLFRFVKTSKGHHQSASTNPLNEKSQRRTPFSHFHEGKKETSKNEFYDS